ncbi:MAG: glycosyl hydrolase [Gammaproteobacteria bacterium]|nr:glycosyl hydrolase [Gammaproteobacteria bacterium]
MSEQGVELHSGATLIVATRKGVFFLQAENDRSAWGLSEPVFLGHIVNHVVLDPRDGTTMLACARTGHLGPTIFRSQDAGLTWTEAARPPAFDKAQPGDKARVVGHTFWLTPGHTDEPGVWYAGTSPQALWISRDAGATWEGVRGFNDHPDYEIRTEDPQAGTPDGPVLHSILIDPREPRHMYLGLSGGGVYETRDQGETWDPLNQGMATTVAEGGIAEGASAEVGSAEGGIAQGEVTEPGAGAPETQPNSIEWQEIGPQHDPHCVQMHPGDPNILYQQNHCGIYRIQRPGDVWDRIGTNMPKEIGDIGFAIGLHPRDPNTCWVFPMDGTDVWPRTSPGGRPAVYATRDAGKSWQRQENGLPERGWFTVKRQSLSVDHEDSAGVYFGTTSGEVWGSADEGEHWRCLAQHLPEIYSIEAVEIA